MPEAFGAVPRPPAPLWSSAHGSGASSGTHFIGIGSPSRLPEETRGEDVTWSWEEAHCQSKLRVTFLKLSESVKRPFYKKLMEQGEGEEV